MIFIGPGSPLVKISGLYRLFSAVLVSVSVTCCQSRSDTVLPVPVFELTGITGLLHLPWQAIPVRVSYETSFDSKQPKMEPKLVSTLSETRRLFRLFRFNIATACFGVSIEPKQ
jgi:hypothetical protein